MTDLAREMVTNYCVVDAVGMVFLFELTNLETGSSPRDALK